MAKVEHDYQWDSVAEMVSALTAPPVVDGNKHRIYPSDGYWVCADRKPSSVEHALELLSEPLYQAGADRVEDLLGKVSVPAPVPRVRRRVWADAGDELCRDRLYAGQTDTLWNVAKRKAAVGPSRVHVILTVRARGDVQSADMARRGTVGAAIAMALKTAGYVVRLSGRVNNEIHTRDGMEPYRATVTLMGESEAFDLHKVASLAASSLLFRGAILAHEYQVATKSVYHVSPPEEGNDAPEYGGFDATIRVMDIPDSVKEMDAVIAKSLAPFLAREEGC